MEVVEITKKNYWAFLLLIIFLTALYIRCIPGTKLVYPQLLEIDTHYFLRMGEYIVEHGKLPENDYVAGWGTIPNGPNRNYYEIVALWTFPMFYFILKPFMPDITMYWIGVWIPAFLGALSVVLMYFLGKELFNDRRIGLLTAAFLAFTPGILYRSSAGWMDKEVIVGIFMVLAFYFFVKSFKESEIKKDASWIYILSHPLTLLDKIKIEESKIKDIKTVVYGFLSALFFVLYSGSSGQVRISLLLIGFAIIFALLFNRYSKRLFLGYISTFIPYLLFSRVFAYAPDILDFSHIVNLIALAFLLIRYVTEKFNVIEKKYIPFITPILLILAVFVTGIMSYVIPDVGMWVADKIERITNPLTNAVIPSTVAESQSVGDFFATSTSYFGTGYAIIAFQWPSFILIFSGIYFALLGLLLISYEMLFKKGGFEHFFVFTSFLITLILAIGAARLAFQFAYPYAILAGYFLIRGGGYVSMYLTKMKSGLRKYIKVTGGLLIGMIILANFASAWVMANNITTPLTEDFYQAMIWLRDNTPENAVLLEWWDYGWWYQYIAKKITLVDGGYHDREPTQDIAKFYTEPFSEDPTPYSSLNFLKNYSVDYVMVSSDLIPKFGAMSKIANWGAKIDVLPVFGLSNNYQEGNKVLLEYGGPQQTIIVAYSVENVGNDTMLKNITALVKMPQGQAYIKKIAIGNQIIVNDKPNSIPGLLYFAGNSVVYIPEAVEDCVFVRLFFFDGKGLEKYFEKVYDNLGIKIYKVLYENFPENITGYYINAADRE